MVPSWARPMIARVIVMAAACVLILGGAWLFSGIGNQKGTAELPPKPQAEPKPKESTLPPKDSASPSVATAEPTQPKPADKPVGETEVNKPPQEAKIDIPARVEAEPKAPPKDAKP